jgi:WXG100 family type VII secretion target
VSFDALAEQSDQLDGVADSMSERVSRTIDTVDELLTQGWSGAAADAFDAAFAEWQEGATDCVAVLKSLVSELRAAATDYASNEQGNLDASQSLQSEASSLGIARMMGGL